MKGVVARLTSQTLKVLWNVRRMGRLWTLTHLMLVTVATRNQSAGCVSQRSEEPNFRRVYSAPNTRCSRKKWTGGLRRPTQLSCSCTRMTCWNARKRRSSVCKCRRKRSHNSWIWFTWMGIPPHSINWWFSSTFLPIRSLWEVFHSKMVLSIRSPQTTPKLMRQKSWDNTVTLTLQLSTRKAYCFLTIHVPKLRALRLIPFLVASSSLFKIKVMLTTSPWVIWIDKTQAILNSLFCKQTNPLKVPQIRSPKGTSYRLSISTETSLQISLFCLLNSKLHFC